MYSAHKLTGAAVALILAISAAGCGDNSRREAAGELLVKAQALVDARNYDSAIVVLDTLDKKYRDCLDERKAGTSVRLTALANLTRDSLAADELQLQQVQADVEALAPQFRKVDVAGTEGYFVDKDAYTGKEMNSNCLQARVDPDGYMFVVANVAGRRIGLSSLRVGDVTTSPAQSVEVEGSEIMSLSQEQAAPVVDAINASDGKSVEVELVGAKGKVSVKLTGKQLAAFANSDRYAKALQRQRRLQITLEKLERQLARLNDQLAAQIPVPEEE